MKYHYLGVKGNKIRRNKEARRTGFYPRCLFHYVKGRVKDDFIKLYMSF